MAGKIPYYIQNSTVTQINEQTKKEMFQSKRQLLRETIQKDIETEKDPLRLKALEAIQRMPSTLEEEYEAKHYVYNYGKFRNSEEIEEYNRKIERNEARKRYNETMERNRLYYQSGQYKEDCKKGKFQCWLPFIIDAGLFLIGLTNPYQFCYMIMWTFYLSPVALLITLILLGIQSNYCEKLAKEHNVPYNDPTYQKARDTSRSARLGIVASAVGAYHATSSAMKSVTNPDTWNSI